MKKLRLLIISLLVLILLPNYKVSAQDKINIYLFRGEGCPHCEEAIKFFNNLSNDNEYKNYYNLISYETWYNSDNKKLMEEVGKKIDAPTDGVPLIVIGKEYFSGYTSDYDDEIKKTIKDNYNSNNYVDVVKNINVNNISEDKKVNSIKSEKESKKKEFDEKEFIKSERPFIIKMIIFILLIVILIIVGILVSNKDKKNNLHLKS